MDYSVVIRTLGKSGEMFAKTIHSLQLQSIKPKQVVVYIAEGYPLPKERTSYEKYVRVPKGMVSQRALSYEEIDSEYVLFLDDDVFLPEDAVEKLYNYLMAHNADVIAPDVFDHIHRSSLTKLKMALIGKSYARGDDRIWGYKALRNGGYSYNAHPSLDVYVSQLNAGPCFFCSKSTFISIRFEDEVWLDETHYALPEDQVMFYKFYKCGYKVLTAFNTGIIHLDAGSTINTTSDRACKVSYSESRNKLIYWHRYLYLPDSWCYKIVDLISLIITNIVRLSLMLIKFKWAEASSWINGLRDGIRYIKSEEYKHLPLIPNNESCYE